MHFSYPAVVLAALALESAVAQPSHRHIHQHKQRDLTDLIGKRQDWNNLATYINPVTKKEFTSTEWQCMVEKPNDPSCYTVDAASSPASAPPASGTDTSVKEKIAAPKASAPAHSSTGSHPSSGSGSCVDISSVWTKGDTSKAGQTAADVGSGQWTDASTSSASLSKRATAAQDGYVGNYGSPYGRNIVPLSDCNDQDHDFSIKFTNRYPDNRDMSVMIWNKVGADLQPQSGPSSNSFFMIDLPAGKSASFAFEPNSQIAFSESSSTCTRQSGAPGDWYCIWGEANFGPIGGDSSWDVSVTLDPSGVPGDLTVSNNGQQKSSRAACGFMNGAQQYAGDGTGVTCNPNTSGKANLLADFGVSES